MRLSVGCACGLVVAGLYASAVDAQARWVGEWYSVPAASRRSAHSFVLAALPDGRLRYDDGDQVIVLARGDRPVPVPSRPHASIVTRELTPTSFRYVELIDGKPDERVEARLSADGTRLLGRDTSLGSGGREMGHDTVAVRVGSGRGLAGRWRELPRPFAPTPTTRPAKPFWIIRQDPRGFVTWSIPSTGEVLRGRADGRSYPMAGTFHAPGKTFVLKALTPRHLQWFFYDHGRFTEEADETLSEDGKLWTDLIWSPAHPEEKDRFVYRRGQG